jgi:ATP-dependent DNA helicase DinG
MTGGDFPAGCPACSPRARAIRPRPPTSSTGAANASTRLPHYRTCFVEKAVRASRRADLVVANHALVMTQAAFDGARAARGLKTGRRDHRLKRIVFDEGHHLFDAADSAFSACLSGSRGGRAAPLDPRSRRPRPAGRGLEVRLATWSATDEGAQKALQDAIRAAAAFPGEGMEGRIAPPSGRSIRSARSNTSWWR